jgi:peptide/nickel transport system permease protein
MVVTLLVITVVCYTMMRLAPGDPTRSQYIGGSEDAFVQSDDARESNIQKTLREKYHLDKPILVGYGYWLWALVTRGDLGTSIIVDPGTPVTQVILERLPITLRLNICAILIIYATAIPIGIYSALRQRKWDERFVTIILFVLYSLPSFWVAVLLLMFFCGDIFVNYFPVAGISPDASFMWGKSYWAILLETGKFYVLPVVCMTYAGLAGLSRYMRVGLLEVMRQDYVRTARAKGLGEFHVIGKHVLRNGILPLITLFAGLLPVLVGGSVVVEYVFSIPGMGSMSLQALSSRDYPLMMALFGMGATLTLLGILLSDLLYAVVDPRITFD